MSHVLRNVLTARNVWPTGYRHNAASQIYLDNGFKRLNITITNLYCCCFPSRMGTRLIGTVFLRITNDFMSPIARSTCIRALATFLVLATSPGVCCSQPDLGGGISSLAWRISSSLLMVKPRSARMTSPGSTRSRKPDSLSMRLLEVLPPQPTERKLAFGAIPIRYFAVLCFL